MFIQVVYDSGGRDDVLMTVKDRLHDAVDAMSDEQADQLLGTIRQQFADRLAGIPLDNEEESEEERAASDEGKADLAAGRVVPWSHVRRKYR